LSRRDLCAIEAAVLGTAALSCHFRLRESAKPAAAVATGLHDPIGLKHIDMTLKRRDVFTSRRQAHHLVGIAAPELRRRGYRRR
jgi:hypothetical protein